MQSLLGNNSSSTKNIQGVIIEEIKVGTGPIAKSGSKVKVHYIGRLKSNGKTFDASTTKPFAFKLGRGEVIRGWDIGCEGMKVGGKRKLTIPPEKAYGKSGAPPTIPGNATLVFEVSMLSIQ
jgi:FK506-binding nuclear protein